MKTRDALFDGQLTIFQSSGGYRFSLDAVLLAGLTPVKPRDRVVELGTGSGVVLLMMAFRRQGARLTGVELQGDLAALARENVRVNGFEKKIAIIESDFRRVQKEFPPASFDLMLSNPPYRRVRSGRINPDEERAIARHELMGEVKDIFAAAAYLLQGKGRLGIVYPSTRLDHLLAAAQEYGLSPKTLTVVFSNATDKARLVHLLCIKGGGEELRINPPFFIYREQGVYSEAMQALYEP